MRVLTKQAIELVTNDLSLEAVADNHSVELQFRFHAKNLDGFTTLVDGMEQTFDTINLGMEETWDVRRKEG